MEGLCCIPETIVPLCVNDTQIKTLKEKQDELVAEEEQSFLTLRSCGLQKGRLGHLMTQGLQQHPYHKRNGSLVSRILRAF